MTGALALSAAILRTLKPADAGLVLLVYTLLAIAATLARFGSDTLAMRETARHSVGAGRLVSQSAGG